VLSDTSRSMQLPNESGSRTRWEAQKQTLSSVQPQLAELAKRLEIKIYGTAAKEIGVYNHEGRFDLWTGMATSPIAVTLKDKANYVDLTGLARLRWMVRTGALHVAHPVVKLADGTFIAGSFTQSNDGEYIQTEVAFANQRWYKLDPEKVVTTVEVKNPDLSKVDEVGLADLMPSGGHGNAGWVNLSTIELYAKPVPR